MGSFMPRDYSDGLFYSIKYELYSTCYLTDNNSNLKKFEH